MATQISSPQAWSDLRYTYSWYPITTMHRPPSSFLEFNRRYYTDS